MAIMVCGHATQPILERRLAALQYTISCPGLNNFLATGVPHVVLPELFMGLLWCLENVDNTIYCGLST
jgi:hypothetical protein